MAEMGMVEGEKALSIDESDVDDGRSTEVVW